MKPVLPNEAGSTLSYLQLVEAAFVASFRASGVRLQTLRQAHEYCRQTLHAQYPFAELEFKTDGVHLFHQLAQYDPAWADAEPLVITDQAGQMGWKAAIRERLAQFEYEHGKALRWRPRKTKNVILIDPRNANETPNNGRTSDPTNVVL